VLVAGVHLTDPQLWIIGLVPMLAATGLWWLLDRGASARRAVSCAVGVAVGAVVVRVVAGAIMRAAGYRELAPDTFSLIHGLGALPSHAHHFFELVIALGNGAVEFSTAGLARGVLSLACAGAIIVAVGLAPALLAWNLARRARVDPALIVHLTFWTVVVAGLTVAMLATNLTDQPSVRYILGLFVAAAAAVPVLLQGSRVARAVALGLTAVLLTGSVVAMADRELASGGPVVAANAAAIERAADATGAHTGLGWYDLASNVTWATHGRVRSRPIIDWVSPICPFQVAVDRGWYVPAPTQRSFVLWHQATPPAQFGSPVQTVVIDPSTWMFVYGGDVRDRLPACAAT
jgi:hypothetical protein